MNSINLNISKTSKKAESNFDLVRTPQNTLWIVPTNKSLEKANRDYVKSLEKKLKSFNR